MADGDAPHTGALLVATPALSDPVNEVSDEEHAHATLLWFGEAAAIPPERIDLIRRHAFDVAGQVEAFSAKASGRAILGDEDAGVLILESEELAQLRTALFASDAVQDAYLGAKQFPHWVPHLTMSYGKGLPTWKPDEIRFDSVGLWLGGQHESFALQPAAEMGEDEQEALLSAGLTIPPVLSIADLPLCVQHAQSHPDARWYATKRAVALDRTDLLPAQWGPG